MIFKNIEDRILLFTIQPYRLFATSGFLATLGNGFLYISMAWYVALQSKSVGAQAILMSCLWGPSILLSPIVGVIADRSNRKTLIVFSNFTRGVAMLSYFLLLLLFELPKSSIYVLAILLGILSSVFGPASAALIRDLIPKKHLLNANTTIDTIYELGMLLGMGMAGLFIAWVPIEGAFFVGGTCFLLASVCDSLMRYHSCSIKPSSLGGLRSMVSEYYAVFGLLRKNEQLAKVFMIQTLLMVPLTTLPMLLVPFAKNILGASVMQFSYLEILLSLGGIVGGISAPIFAEKFDAKKTLVAFTACLSISIFVFGNGGYYYCYYYMLYMLIGITLSSWSIAISQVQALAEVDYLGRVQAASTGFSTILILSIVMAIILLEDKISISFIYRVEGLIVFFAMLLALSVTEKRGG